MTSHSTCTLTKGGWQGPFGYWAVVFNLIKTSIFKCKVLYCIIETLVCRLGNSIDEWSHLTPCLSMPDGRMMIICEPTISMHYRHCRIEFYRVQRERSGTRRLLICSPCFPRWQRERVCQHLLMILDVEKSSSSSSFPPSSFFLMMPELKRKTMWVGETVSPCRFPILPLPFPWDR